MLDYNLDWKKVFYYDPESPSGLRWIKDRGKMKFGDIAGSKSYNDKKQTKPKCWDVRYGNCLYKAHRIVWVILNGSIDDDLVINHIDNNPHNNKADNLELVTQDVNIRRCSAHTGVGLQTNNISGINGVASIFDNETLVSYNASVRDYPDGQMTAYNFSVIRYGEDLALLLAETARNYMIKVNNSKGANYAIF